MIRGVSVRIAPLGPATSRLEFRIRRAHANAINRTLEEAQVRGRQLIHQRLTVRTARSARFLENLVKFERFDRAAPDKLSGTMGLQDTGSGTKRRSAKLLIRLSRGGVFTQPATRPFYVPTRNLRSSPPTVIPHGLYPSSLRLVETRFTINRPGKQKQRHPGGWTVKGKRRSYAIDPEFHRPTKAATLGIWQRTGRGRTRFLWLYRTRIRLRQRYPFLSAAGREVQERWPINVRGFLASEARRNRLAHLRAAVPVTR